MAAAAAAGPGCSDGSGTKRRPQLYTMSRERVALFGYFENCTHCFQEYVFGYSYALIDSLKRIATEYGRVAIVMDRMSAHNSKAVKKFLRKYRATYPGRDIQPIFLPHGLPYLNVVEECWNLLKKSRRAKLLLAIRRFSAAVSEYSRTARFSRKIETFLYQNPEPHLEVAAR